MLVTLLIVLFPIFKPITSQRRIIHGEKVEGDSTAYMVYLVKAKQSEKNHDNWLCGGCIVHPFLIMTSAACVVDVQYVYAIAGYKKYVRAEQLEKDECTKHMKKRVTSYCVPTDFNLQYMQYLFTWAQHDLAFARVETPYNFYDTAYLKYCSYMPKVIRMGFNSDMFANGTEAITLGWGSSKYYRPVGNTNDYNEHELRYTSIVLSDKKRCSDSMPDADERDSVTRFWICAFDKGHLDVNGMVKDEFKNITGCAETRRGSRRCQNVKEGEVSNDFDFRLADHNQTVHLNSIRRHGTCQNDHGGPLVVWYGGHAYAVGVASAFFVDTSMECIPPYTFTTIHCLGKYVKCLTEAYSVNLFTVNQRRFIGAVDCQAPAEKGFELEMKDIKWT